MDAAQDDVGRRGGGVFCCDDHVFDGANPEVPVGRGFEPSGGVNG